MFEDIVQNVFCSMGKAYDGALIYKALLWYDEDLKDKNPLEIAHEETTNYIMGTVKYVVVRFLLGKT